VTPHQVPPLDKFTVATYNVHHARPDSEIRADISKLITAGAAVICLQEMGGHISALAHLPTGWEAWVPTVSTTGGRADTPILYNSAAVVHVRHGTRVVSPPATVEPGQGGVTVPEKTITWIRLRVPRTDVTFVVCNTHAVASVEGLGHPALHHPKRVALFVDLMRQLELMVRARQHAAVVVAGDLNVDYRADSEVRDVRFPYTAFPRMGLRSSYHHDVPPLPEGTSGNRLIDYVAHTPGHGLEYAAQTIGDGYGSDHRPLLVTYHLTQKAT
jgi:endonuclease/exonuclease/phosphatase family metal-dependent hydrolase